MTRPPHSLRAADLNWEPNFECTARFEDLFDMPELRPYDLEDAAAAGRSVDTFEVFPGRMPRAGELDDPHFSAETDSSRTGRREGSSRVRHGNGDTDTDTDTDADNTTNTTNTADVLVFRRVDFHPAGLPCSTHHRWHRSFMARVYDSARPDIRRAALHRARALSILGGSNDSTRKLSDGGASVEGINSSSSSSSSSDASDYFSDYAADGNTFTDNGGAGNDGARSSDDDDDDELVVVGVQMRLDNGKYDWLHVVPDTSLFHLGFEEAAPFSAFVAFMRAIRDKHRQRVGEHKHTHGGRRGRRRKRVKFVLFGGNRHRLLALRHIFGHDAVVPAAGHVDDRPDTAREDAVVPETWPSSATPASSSFSSSPTTTSSSSSPSSSYNYDRGTLHGLRGAVAELLLVEHCHLVLSTFGSGFLELAGMAFGVPNVKVRGGANASLFDPLWTVPKCGARCFLEGASPLNHMDCQALRPNTRRGDTAAGRNQARRSGAATRTTAPAVAKPPRADVLVPSRYLRNMWGLSGVLVEPRFADSPTVRWTDKGKVTDSRGGASRGGGGSELTFSGLDDGGRGGGSGASRSNEPFSSAPTLTLNESSTDLKQPTKLVFHPIIDARSGYSIVCNHQSPRRAPIDPERTRRPPKTARRRVRQPAHIRYAIVAAGLEHMHVAVADLCRHHALESAACDSMHQRAGVVCEGKSNHRTSQQDPAAQSSGQGSQPYPRPPPPPLSSSSSLPSSTSSSDAVDGRRACRAEYVLDRSMRLGVVIDGQELQVSFGERRVLRRIREKEIHVEAQREREMARETAREIAREIARETARETERSREREDRVDVPVYVLSNTCSF